MHVLTFIFLFCSIFNYCFLLYRHLLYHHWIIPKSTRPSLTPSRQANNFNFWYNTDHRAADNTQCGVEFLGVQRTITGEQCPMNIEFYHDDTLTWTGTGSERRRYEYSDSNFFIADKKGFQPVDSNLFHNWHCKKRRLLCTIEQ